MTRKFFRNFACNNCEGNVLEPLDNGKWLRIFVSWHLWRICGCGFLYLGTSVGYVAEDFCILAPVEDMWLRIFVSWHQWRICG